MLLSHKQTCHIYEHRLQDLLSQHYAVVSVMYEQELLATVLFLSQYCVPTLTEYKQELYKLLYKLIEQYPREVREAILSQSISSYTRPYFTNWRLVTKIMSLNKTNYLEHKKEEHAT